jgi:hypothetical protein
LLLFEHFAHKAGFWGIYGDKNGKFRKIYIYILEKIKINKTPSIGGGL